MTLFDKIASYSSALEASENAEGIIKVAAENDVSVNDMIIHHNLVNGNVFTGENIIKVAEDQEASALEMAIDVYEKLASDEINEDQAMAALEEAGLTVEDYNKVATEIDRQAEEAGMYDSVQAEEAVWDKIAEASEYLASHDIDAIAALEFADSFANAEDEEAQDKVASEYEDLSEEAIDKIAEVMEFLGDIEGASLVDLMAEYEKEAASMKGAVDSVVGGAKAAYNKDVTKKDAKSGIKGAWNSYKAAITGKGAKKVAPRLEAAKAELEKQEKGLAGLKDKANGSGNMGLKSGQQKAVSLLGKKKKLVGSAREGVEKESKNMRRIRVSQAKAIGGTAATAGAVGAGGYIASKN